MTFLFLLLVPFLHDYHVSVADVVYNEDENAIQISYRMFLDDLELALRAESKNADLNIVENKEQVSEANEAYFQRNLKIKVNGRQTDFNYVGQEIEDDGMWSYLEITGIHEKPTIEIVNNLLLDVYDDQQNIIHFKIAGDKKSFILNKAKRTATYPPN